MVKCVCVLKKDKQMTYDWIYLEDLLHSLLSVPTGTWFWDSENPNILYGNRNNIKQCNISIFNNNSTVNMGHVLVKW